MMVTGSDSAITIASLAQMLVKLTADGHGDIPIEIYGVYNNIPYLKHVTFCHNPNEADKNDGENCLALSHYHIQL